MEYILEKSPNWKIDWRYIILFLIFTYIALITPSFILQIILIPFIVYCLLNIIQIEN
jgi:hypothetical protein